MRRSLDRRPRPVLARLGAALALGALVAGCAAHEATPPAGSPVATVPPTVSPAASAVSPAASSTEGPATKVAGRLTPEGLRVHLAALDEIARANGGSRAVGTPGFDATVRYATQVLAGAGYDVVTQPFVAEAWNDPGGNALRITGEADRTFRDGTDFLSFGFSPPGVVEAPLTTVADPCAAGAFGADVRATIVVVGPGNCAWLPTAEAAGVAAVIVTSGRPAGRLPRMLFEPDTAHVPIVMASAETGAALAAAAGSIAHLDVTGSSRMVPTMNILAELPGTDPDRVIVLGAHLDSAVGVPGLDDDGTGVAAVLETARLLAGERPGATIRFALWSAEELGLIGSARYVATLPDAERTRIEGYVNADMLGAVHGVRAIHAGPKAARNEGPLLSRLGAYLKSNGLAFEIADIVERTDALPFNEAGIPVAGLLSVLPDAGSEDGMASTDGVPMDPCYHLACDDLHNVDLTRTAELADALAWAVIDLAWGEAGSLASPAP
jgi:hypothetical protein